ncbi:MAG: tetratricopeptide repeat protein [Desulfovibrio sp.]|jgi:tetratricopeptide (TPR) repeat protein|nr:tetratricopeptide repeat protein [Desulfovibrio sp.]
MSAAQLTAAQEQVRIKSSHYEKTIADFTRDERGLFVLLTEDQSFLKAFRSLLGKQLGLVLTDVIDNVPEADKLIKTIKTAADRGRRPFLILERIFKSRDMSLTVKEIKEAFPRIFILILTVEIEQNRVIYLYESGADNFIAKPVSTQTIMEKLAFTIKPQNQLGESIDLAKSLLQQDQPEKAKDAAEQILQMKPGSAAGLMILGDAERAMGNMDAARQAYKQAADSSGLYLEPLNRLASLAEEMGEMEQCLNYLERMDKLSPLNMDRKINMGEINLTLGQDEKAAGLFESALAQAEKEAAALISSMAERIAGLYAEKDPLRSEIFLRKALNIKKEHLTHEDLRVFNMLGINLRRQGKWEEAIAEYTRALKIAPEDEGLHYNLGMAYAQGEKMGEARTCMEKSLSLNENFPQVSDTVAFNLGYVFLKSGREKRARTCFETALRLNPEHEGAARALATLDRSPDRLHRS